MKITYDPEVDALYIKLRDGVARTERVSDDVAIDYNADGAVAGIEILSAKQVRAHGRAAFLGHPTTLHMGLHRAAIVRPELGR